MPNPSASLRDKGLLDGKQLRERSNLPQVTGKIASVEAFSHLRRLTSRNDATARKSFDFTCFLVISYGL